jgi:hypothetical protein
MMFAFLLKPVLRTQTVLSQRKEFRRPRWQASLNFLIVTQGVKIQTSSQGCRIRRFPACGFRANLMAAAELAALGWIAGFCFSRSANRATYVSARLILVP